MVDWNAIEEKWLAAWKEAKLFEADAHAGKKKFFLTFPYPYMNGYMHIGHFYTMMRVEAFARYKRHKGFQVLFPQGWHCTGSPIEAAAQRIREHEEKQWKIMRDMGFNDNEIMKFGNPEHWARFFPGEAKKDLARIGLSIDFRRSFITTSLNPHYDKFIQWQFRTLKEKGFVQKGRHPVVWCPKENTPVGDHARSEGEGETPQEFVLLKFKLGDSYLVAATLRPETVFGQTNLWISPDIEYVKASVDGEHWIVSAPCAQKLKEQHHAVTIIKTVKGAEFIGKSVIAPMINRPIPILPASFCDPNKGTGIVTSVPSDAPDDYIGLRDLQGDKEAQKKYGLDHVMLDAIKPIPIITTAEYGEQAAVKLVEDMQIKSQHERAKLEEAKHLVYKAGFYAGKMNASTGKYAGKPVKDVKDQIKSLLIKKKQAELFYELTGKVVCRCLTPSIVKIVDNQWFVTYGDKKWKKTAHAALNNLTLYPEKARQQFDYVIDWLNDWACTREYGLGTKLPWDQDWVIESLSDSTVYMAYYTIAHHLEKLPASKVDDNLFNYVFFGKDKRPDVAHIDDMRAEFEYWYPLDFRNSGKDLIQNHLTFFLFHHTGLFAKNNWPQGIGVNGWVTVDGEKMSKSKGNFLLIRDLPTKWRVDPSRITILSGGEGLDDTNWDSDMAVTMKGRFEWLHDFCTTQYGKGRSDTKSVDKWFSAEIDRIVKDATDAMELTNFRTAIQRSYFDMQNALKWYGKRTTPNKKAMNKFIETQIILLEPFAPIICEEMWHAIGNKGFATTAEWPRVVKKLDIKSLAAENIVRTVVDDIRQVLILLKIAKPTQITIVTAPVWKYELYEEMKKNTSVKNPGEMIKMVMQGHLKQHGDNVVKLIAKAMNKLPSMLVAPEDEYMALSDAKEFFAKEFGCDVNVVQPDQTKETRAGIALPGKPAIIVK